MSRAATRMAIVAVIPIAQADAANAAMAAAGHGEGAFGVLGYTDGVASHAALHAWHCEPLASALEAIPGIGIGISIDIDRGDPVARTTAALAAHGATLMPPEDTERT